MLKRIINKVKRLAAMQPEPFAAYKKESWSQSGEDVIIEYLFGLRKITKPTCLDIGSYHPVVANNTYKFFLKGASCVNIDANPSAVEKFKDIRPGDVNLNIGVGGQKGNFDFYIMNDEALNTFSAEEMKSLLKSGSSVKEIKIIEMLPVNEVLEKYFAFAAPDFISIDAEGVDEDIIVSYDFSRFAPKVICIESINYTPDGTGSKRFELCSKVEAAGYFEYANTNINSIFVNKGWWFGK